MELWTASLPNGDTDTFWICTSAGGTGTAHLQENGSVGLDWEAKQKHATPSAGTLALWVLSEGRKRERWFGDGTRICVLTPSAHRLKVGWKKRRPAPDPAIHRLLEGNEFERVRDD